MKTGPLIRFPITPGPWKACRSHEDFGGPLWDLDPEDAVEYNARPFTSIQAESGTVVTAHDLFEFRNKTDALALAKVPELLQIALWAEAALGYLAAKAGTAEDRAEFERRYRETTQVLNEIRA